MGYARRKGNPLRRAIAVIKIHNSHCINFMIKNTLIFARLVTVQTLSDFIRTAFLYYFALFIL